MNRLRLRSLEDQLGRLIALGLLVAVLAFTAVAAPRLGERLLDSALRSMVDSASPSARDLITTVNAAHLLPSPGQYLSFTISPTWNAMPKAMARARASMPSALRDATGGGRFVGIGSPGAQGESTYPGFTVAGAAGSPLGTLHVVIEAYPELPNDATLAAGHWPTAPQSNTAPIPVVIADSAAMKLHWRIGQIKEIPSSRMNARSLLLVGTVRPRSNADDFWRLSPTRAHALSAPNADGELQYGATVWASATDWPTTAQDVAGTRISSWYPVSGSGVSLSRVAALQNGLTTSLANPYVIKDGTGDAHTLRLATSLQSILIGFRATESATSLIMTLAAATALGVGLLVLLASVSLLVRARRPIRELMRTRGASVAALTRGVAVELAWAAVPGALVGATGAILIAAGPPESAAIGLRDVVTALICALVPVVAGGLFVRLGEGLPGSFRAAVARQRWIGEIFLVVLAVAAFVAILGETRSGGHASGAPDPLSVALVLLAGLAGSVIAVRGLTVLSRSVGRAMRGRGRPAVFVGVLEATRTSGIVWMVTAALTSAAAGVLSLILVTSVGHAALQAHAGPGPSALIPGVAPYVVAGVGLCIVFATAVFAVSCVAETTARRRLTGMLRMLGFSRSETTRVSAWGIVPAAVVSTIVGAAIGVLCAVPVIGVFPALPAGGGADGSGISIAVGAVVSWPLVWGVVGSVLMLAVVISFIAVGADAHTVAGSAAAPRNTDDRARRMS